MFSTRPSPTYRPTLSPVYSKSPIPTNSLSQLASTSPKPTKVPLSGPVSAAPNIPPPTIPSPSQSPSRPPPPKQTELRDHDVSRSPLPSSASTVSRERALQSGNEIVTLRKKWLYGRPRQPTTTGDDIPLFKLPPPKVKPVNWKQGPYQKPSDFRGASPRMAEISRPLNFETDSPRPPDLRGLQDIPHPSEDLSKTPTSSALEFWAVADASLAPSESASAQAPNRRGEPPPDIWKDADKTLNLRKSGPTMEEWIASLPGLGLRLGSWAPDRNLDSIMLKQLRVKTPKPSPVQADELLRARLAGELNIMENRVFDQGEEFVPEDELGLTLEEVKSLELLEDEPVPENAPPAIIDPFLLHPEYIPSPIPSVVLTPVSAIAHPLPTVPECEEGKMVPLARTRAYNLPGVPGEETHNFLDSPSNRSLERPLHLASDVISRLNALEKYWDEQGIVVGTVLRRMLWIVDIMIIKEREEAQRLIRRKEMGWMDSEAEESEDGGGKSE